MLTTYVRKILLIGRRSYAITLPKEWVVRSGLKEGSPLAIHMLSDGSLKITMLKEVAKPREEGESFTLVLKRGEELGIERLLVALYSAGYDRVRIVQRPVLSGKTRSLVQKTLRKLSGFEVTEEAADYILLQSIIDAGSLPLERTVERMEVLVRSMLSDLARAGELEFKEVLQLVIERDDELDKFYFLLSRQLSILLMRPELAEKMGVANPVLALPLKSYGKVLEEMGDVLVSLSRWLLQRGERLKKPYCEILKEAFTNAVKAFKLGDDRAGKLVTSRYVDYFSKSIAGDFVYLLVGRFLALCVAAVEAGVDKKALEQVLSRR